MPDTKLLIQFFRSTGCYPPCRLPTYDLVVKTSFDRVEEKEGGIGTNGSISLRFYASRSLM